MTEGESQPTRSLIAPEDAPLIAVPKRVDGRNMVQYFVDEDAADAAVSDEAVQEALSLAGAWSDLDWDEAIEELDRIRHQSTPTPPHSNGI